VSLYPLAGVLAVRRGGRSSIVASIAACLLPASYFTAIGIADGNWHTSSTAIVRVCIAFAITLLCAMSSDRSGGVAFSAPEAPTRRASPSDRQAMRIPALARDCSLASARR
jgi:hypothetical protein